MISAHPSYYCNNVYLSRRGFRKSMKGRGFTETFPSINISERDKSVYFWSWFGCNDYSIKIAKTYLVLRVPASKRGHLQSVILFILSTAAAIISQTKSQEMSAMSIHSVVKLNINNLSFVCVTLHHNDVKWRRVTFFYWCHWRVISCCVKSKSKCAGLFLVCRYVLYFCRRSKRHIYVPLYEAVILRHCIIKSE